MVEFVEPTLTHGGLQADPRFTVFPDGSDQTVAVDKIDHRNGHGRRLAGGFSEPAQGQQNDPLGALGLGIMLEQDHGLPADGFTIGVIALGPATLAAGLCRYPLLGGGPG